MAQAGQSGVASDGTAEASPGRYVAKNPETWIGHHPVGSGECVALVQAATGAPHSSEWREGSQVAGDNRLKPGTAIATFDRNGHYSGHATIYLGQDERGIRVIDQWNYRDPKTGVITGQQWPHERTLPFHGAKAPINRGETYRVVQ